jgi:hypothetical protein
MVLAELFLASTLSMCRSWAVPTHNSTAIASLILLIEQPSRHASIAAQLELWTWSPNIHTTAGLVLIWWRVDARAVTKQLCRSMQHGSTTAVWQCGR